MNSIQESQKFVIQQTLHGYSDGHRMLASSCNIPRDVESLMLILSDLSGPGGDDKFDPYLTGYPLGATGRYALACTWPAPEMGRPGCVWTHTLLLGEELLAKMNNPEEFLGLFTRPRSTSELTGYVNEIRVPDSFGARERRTVVIDDWTERVGPQILQAVYSKDAPFTILTVPRYAAAATPILSVWRLQWPKLRSRFTFCGGARALRTIERRPMNVQAAVERDARRLDRGTDPPTVIPLDGSYSEIFEEWVAVAMGAFLASDTNNLVGIFNTIGNSLPGDPALLPPVVMAYEILQRSPDAYATARDLVEFTANQFPDVISGSEFKLAFLGSDHLTGLPDRTVISALATTEQTAAFDASALQARRRAAAMWEIEQEAWNLMSLLLFTAKTTLAETVLEGLVDAISSEALAWTLDVGGDVLRVLLHRRPQIAATPKFWSLPNERQNRAAQALHSNDDGIQELFSEITEAALEVEADPVAPDLVEIFGDKSVPVILEWLNGAPKRPSRLQRGWKLALRRKSSQMLQWLQVKQTVANETARFILSNCDLDAAIPSDELVAILNRYLPRIKVAEMENGPSLACLALKFALKAESPEGFKLAAASFDTVHQAAMDLRLPDDAWWNIEGNLPLMYWWQDWDRCERLRMALIERLRSGQWPASSLVEMTKDDVLFGSLVAELRHSRSGQRVLQDASKYESSAKRRAMLIGD